MPEALDRLHPTTPSTTLPTAASAVSVAAPAAVLPESATAADSGIHPADPVAADSDAQTIRERMSAYRAAAHALDDAVAALIGDDVANSLVDAQVVPYPMRARLQIVDGAFLAIRDRLAEVRVEPGAGTWHAHGKFGDVEVVAVFYARPDWLPAEVAS